jgi:hypothetical protein
MISILGLIAVFIAAYFVYKSARDTGRNAVGWSLLTVVAGIGLQIVLPGIIFFIIAALMAISGKPIRDVDDLPFGTTILVSIVGWAASIIGIWLILRHVSLIPDEETFDSSPAPPTFDGK